MDTRITQQIIQQSREIIVAAHRQIATVLEQPEPNAPTAAAAHQMLDNARKALSSWREVGLRLHIDEAQTKRYIDLLRAVQHLEPLPAEDSQARSKSLITYLQLINELELIKQQNDAFTWSSRYDVLVNADAADAVRQMRAIELLIRHVVDEAWSDQEKLIRRMRELLPAEQIKKIIKSAEKGNILSGTLLEQLRIIFTDQQDFPDYYDPYFQTASALNYESSIQRTLSVFLQALNPIRNKIAHHKALSEAELLLLNEFFDQVIEPLQHAHDEGTLKIDPRRLYHAPQEELSRYQQQIESQLKQIRQITDVIKHLVEQTKSGLNKMDRKLTFALAGIAGVLVISTGTWLSTGHLGSKLNNIGSQLENVKQETSADPRKELANLGISWEQKSLQQAVIRGDLRTVKLLNEGGMSMDPEYLIQAMLAWYRSDKNGDIKATIEYITQHAQRRINTQSDRCSSAIYFAREEEKKGRADDDINTKIIRYLCSTTEGKASFIKERQLAIRDLATLNDQYTHDRQPSAECVRENMKDNGQALANKLFLYSSYTPDIRTDVSTRAAIETVQHFPAYRNATVSTSVVNASAKYFCDARSQIAQQFYPPLIQEATQKTQRYDRIATVLGITP
ncbi:STY4199 family HEPN domain-containing protein [Musicola keenii]|uniref:STY4199 family HEPN domain-containing protein n=1 Tax=Musicola keenii TaxID=2884250 RepID=UPI00178327BE|nr:STY4199 family HEPN domain-containing protein [Musicola keenii]